MQEVFGICCWLSLDIHNTEIDIAIFPLFLILLWNIHLSSAFNIFKSISDKLYTHLYMIVEG